MHTWLDWRFRACVLSRYVCYGNKILLLEADVGGGGSLGGGEDGKILFLEANEIVEVRSMKIVIGRITIQIGVY